MNTAIHDKNGYVTAYGFDCGYVETFRTFDNTYSATLSKEHGVYFIRGFFVNQHFSDTARTITEAYKTYRSRIKEISQHSRASVQKEWDKVMSCKRG